MVVTGFAIRMAVGVMSMGPGRVGIHEGTIAGTYHLLGTPLEEAVVVSILFRVVFQLIPLALSLSLSWRMLRPTGTTFVLRSSKGLSGDDVVRPAHHKRGNQQEQKNQHERGILIHFPFALRLSKGGSGKKAVPQACAEFAEGLTTNGKSCCRQVPVF